MSSVRTKRITAAAIGLTAAVGIALGASASPALAATSTGALTSTTATVPSTGNTQQILQGHNNTDDYYCDQAYNGYYYGYYDKQLHYGNHYYPCNYTLPERIPDPTY
ncbi:MAG: hypothetical protein ACREQ5_14790 [Candidatus Dormibacteria bacterium]